MITVKMMMIKTWNIIRAKAVLSLVAHIAMDHGRGSIAKIPTPNPIQVWFATKQQKIVFQFTVLTTKILCKDVRNLRRNFAMMQLLYSG